MTKQTFLQGTMILIFAGIVTKILGFINKMIVVRAIGQEGFGIYMMIFPTLILTVTLTQLGLPVAISKMVAEADALNDRKKIKRILVVSFITTAVSTVIFTTLMIVSAPFLAHHLFPDPRTMYPLIAISAMVPIIALAAVLRGYFQGLSNMRPYAFSQIIEQIVRLSFVSLLVTLLLPYGLAIAAAGVVLSGILGEAVSLCYMLAMFKVKKKIKVRRGFFNYLKGSRDTFRDLMGVALPATGSRLVGSVTYFFEPIVITNSLILAGIPVALATKQYGDLAGLAIPLLFLPMFITFAISVSLVPVISEAAAKKQYDIIQYRLHQALKISMIAGGISVIITFVFAYPLMDILYDAREVGMYVKMMAPFVFLHFFQGPLQSALQALGHAKAAMINSVIGSVVKMAAIFALATRPELGITGAALAIAASIVLVTSLHFATVVKSAGFIVVVRDYIKGFLCICVTALVAGLLYRHALPSLALMPRTLLLITAVTMLYLVVVGRSGLIQKDEVIRLPFIGKLAAKWLIN
jgi:stage V sporulation protein B